MDEDNLLYICVCANYKRRMRFTLFLGCFEEEGACTLPPLHVKTQCVLFGQRVVICRPSSSQHRIPIVERPSAKDSHCQTVRFFENLKVDFEVVPTKELGEGHFGHSSNYVQPDVQSTIRVNSALS